MRLRTSERTFYNASARSHSIAGRSTVLTTRWGALQIIRPDDGHALFWWYQPGYGVLSIPHALSRLYWHIRRAVFA